MKTDGSDADKKFKGIDRSPIQSLKDMMNSDYVKNRFMEVMGGKASSFLASVLNAAQKNPEIAKCESHSVLSAAMVAATLDLPIDSNLGFSAIVPYNTKRKGKDGVEYWASVAQFQIMYKGFIQLALRSGQYKTINVSPIYEDEFESYDIITGDIRIRPVEDGHRAQENLEKIIGYVAFFRLLNGYERIEYWSIKKIEAHGKRYSKSFDSPYGLWKKDPHAMYAKTVLKNTLSRWGMLSVTMQTAIVADQAAIQAFDRPIDEENVFYIDATKPQNENSVAEATEKRVNPEEPERQDNASSAESGVPDPAIELPDENLRAPQEKAPAAEKTETAYAEKKATTREKKETLFPQDEEDALEEQYRRSRGAPDFGD
jgi:recombination protein RecT